MDLNDYAEVTEVTEVTLTRYGDIMPPKNDKILLIDADTLVFTTCLSLQVEEELLPLNMYDKDQLDEIVTNPTFNEATDTIRIIDLEEAETMVLDKIKDLLDMSGATGYECHFTVGKNFRYSIYPDYKGNRKGREVPSGNRELKRLLTDKYDNFYSHSECEADDAVCSIYMDSMGVDDIVNPTFILTAIDKDVYNSVRGRHLNYFSRVFPNGKVIKPKFMLIEEDVAWKNPFKQALMGDTQDNIIGLAGIGEAKASKLLVDAKDEVEAWEIVLNAFKAIGITKEENKAIKAGTLVIDDTLAYDRALLNMRLVHMLQCTFDIPKREFKEVTLWTPKGED